MEEVKKEKGQVVQLIFLMVIIIALGVMLYSTITILRYKDMLSNPVGYNLDKFGINSCECVRYSGEKVNIPSINYKPQLNTYFNP